MPKALTLTRCWIKATRLPGTPRQQSLLPLVSRCGSTRTTPRVKRGRGPFHTRLITPKVSASPFHSSRVPFSLLIRLLRRRQYGQWRDPAVGAGALRCCDCARWTGDGRRGRVWRRLRRWPRGIKRGRGRSSQFYTQLADYLLKINSPCHSAMPLFNHVSAR